jgi:Zn-dependent protease with chaperone function
VPFGDSRGFFLFLSLLTESFAVRALLGSLAAGALAALAVRLNLVRTTRARRLLVLAPVLTAAVAAVASLRDAEAYLPQLWVATGAAGTAGQVLDLLGELRVVSTRRGVDLLLGLYGVVVAILLLRRVAGCLAVRRMLRRAASPAGHGYLVPLVDRLAGQLRIAPPAVVLLPRCPGGAFTVGTRSAVVAIDPLLLQRLDDRELEGLLAHELAHIRRRDTLLRGVVGVFRDLTFFLPTIHVAARWLRHEQEESADAVASRHTGRPFALASSILKVWDSHHEIPSPAAACAAVPSRRLAFAVAGGGSPTTDRLSGAARSIAIRVERLLEAAPQVSAWRARGEVGFAAAVLLAATSTALVVPSWIDVRLNGYNLSFAYLSAPPVAGEESPAFATFRVLTEQAGTEELPAPQVVVPWATEKPACPCVERPAQLREGIAASGAGSAGMLWRASSQDPWKVNNVRERAEMQALPLWTLTDSGPHVGFFLVAHSRNARN